MSSRPACTKKWDPVSKGETEEAVYWVMRVKGLVKRAGWIAGEMLWTEDGRCLALLLGAFCRRRWKEGHWGFRLQPYFKRSLEESSCLTVEVGCTHTHTESRKIRQASKPDVLVDTEVFVVSCSGTAEDFWVGFGGGGDVIRVPTWPSEKIYRLWVKTSALRRERRFSSNVV